jgi:phospholipid-binding lipoprotein MlaA
MTRLIPSYSATISRIAVQCLAIGGFVAVSACARSLVSDAVNDPHEVENRQMFAFNTKVDSHVLKPVAGKVGDGRGTVATGIKHFADNLDVPGDVVNDVLQLRLGRAVHNTLRFALNSTVGVAGVFDPATAVGLEAKETDFGETLYVWGVDEGAYQVLPLVGPSTARDTAGMVADYALNPLRFVIKSPESYLDTAAHAIDKVNSRARHSATIDSILYDSADAYEQARLLYLQNRRYALGQTPSEDTFEDPYAQ